MTAGPPERSLLACVIVENNAERLRAALIVARCEVALGGEARLFLQGPAVGLLHPPIESDQDATWLAAGEPALGALLLEALDDGVAISVCQSGLVMARMPADGLDKRVAIGGSVGFLAALDSNARLLIA